MLDILKRYKASNTPEKITHHFAKSIKIKHPYTETILAYEAGVAFFEEHLFTFDKIYQYLSYIIIEGKHNHNDIMMKIKHHGHTIESIYMIKTPRETIRIRCDLSYDGTQFKGFQRQNHKNTVQNELESVLKHLYQQIITIHPASRTDTSVHALHQVVHFDCPNTLTPLKLKTLLNDMLPNTIHVISAKQVPAVFHARYDTISKTYQYHFHHYRDPFKANYSVYREGFNLNELNNTLQPFIGTHDFASFAKSEDKKTLRTIYNAVAVSQDKHTIIEITGNGFLRHMVRMIIGKVLHDLNHQNKTIKRALDNPSADTPKLLAPPEGLYLAKIHYQ